MQIGVGSQVLIVIVQQQGGVVDGGKPQSRNPNPPKVVAVGGTGEDSRMGDQTAVIITA